MAWSDKARAAAALVRGRWKGAKTSRSLAKLKAAHPDVGFSASQRKMMAGALRLARKGEGFVNPQTPVRAAISTRMRNLQRSYSRK